MLWPLAQSQPEIWCVTPMIIAYPLWYVSAEIFVERDKFLKHCKTVWLWRRIKQRLQESSTIHMWSPRGRKAADEKLYSLFSEAEFMWSQWAGVTCFGCHWKQKSSGPVSKSFYIYSYHIPCASTSANVAVLWAGAEKWACCRLETREKGLFSAGWVLDVLWTEQGLTLAQGCMGGCISGAETRVGLRPPPPPQNGCVAATQDTTYQLLIHLALLLCRGFWHPPLLTGMPREVGDSQTVWNHAGKGSTASTWKCAWWMGSKIVPLSFSCLRSISSVLAGGYI